MSILHTSSRTSSSIGSSGCNHPTTIPLLLPTFQNEGELLWKGAKQTIRTILFYKPPVGIVSVLIGYRYLFLRNNKKVLSSSRDVLDLEAERLQGDIDDQRRLQQRNGRSLDLDAIDRMYNKYGGVESVRVYLCYLAIHGIVLHQPQTLSKTKANTHKRRQQQQNEKKGDALYKTVMNLKDEKTRHLLQAAVDILRVTYQPKGSRECFVETSIGPLSRLERLLITTTDEEKEQDEECNPLKLSTSTTEDNDDNKLLFHVLCQAAKVGEIRTLDAVLRILRDRLILSSARVQKDVMYWSWAVAWFEEGYGRRLKRFLRKYIRRTTLESDRKKLILASAEFSDIVQLLGKVQKLLLCRPEELPEKKLISVFVETDDTINTTVTPPSSSSSEGLENTNKEAIIRILFDKEVDDTSHISGSSSKWTKEAHQWTSMARNVIYETISESMPGGTIVKDKHQLSIVDRKKRKKYKDVSIISAWSKYESDIITTTTTRSTDEEHDKVAADRWKSVLHLTNNISKFQTMKRERLATGRSTSRGGLLVSYFTIEEWIKKIDFWGIPSSAMTIGAAFIVHNTMKQYWPQITTTSKEIWKVIWGVIDVRFYKPTKEIIGSLLNKNPPMVDPMAVQNEQESLDRMLKDLGAWPTGTDSNTNGPSNPRALAVAAASRMYENELSKGAVKGLVAGKIIRLLLVQVQQLKSDLLIAMDSIDDLVEGNRLNVQLLASIPAVLLVTYGTKILFQTLYSLRAKDVRSTTSVHTEMLEYLEKIEKCLLLANHEYDHYDDASSIPTTRKAAAATPTPTVKKDKKTGDDDGDNDDQNNNDHIRAAGDAAHRHVNKMFYNQMNWENYCF